jgi:hypothetical protein
VSVQPFHALLYPLDPMTMLAVARAAAADAERAVAHARPLQVVAVYHQNYYHHHLHHNHNYRHHSRHHVYHDGCRRGLLWILNCR